MDFDQSTLLSGYAVGTVGVVGYVVTIFLRMSPTRGWGLALLATLGLTAPAAAYLAYAAGSTTEDALVGFAFGGVVFGVAVGLMNMSRIGPSFESVVLLAIFTVSVPTAGVFGALLGQLYESRLAGDAAPA